MVTQHPDPGLHRLALLPDCPGDIRLGARLIKPGDERALLDTEKPSPAAVMKVWQQSGAARRIARELLGQEPGLRSATQRHS
ncbi:MAG: hypothetical protein ACK5HY_15490, partial [Parahaliea sp.]